MRHGTPPGYALYGDVLTRLGGEFVPAGAGLNFSCPFPHPKGTGDRNPSAWVRVGDRGELVARCNGCGAGWQDFVSFVGLPASAWWPQPLGGDRAVTRRRAAVQSKIVAEYPYTDPQSNALVAVKLRWEPGFDGAKRKDFTWRRPLPDKYRGPLKIPVDAFAWCGGPGVLKGGEFSLHKKGSDGTWYFRPTEGSDRESVVLDPVEVGPYREFEALASDPSGSVFVVEGEGKADLLWGIGLAAVSGPAGKGKWDTQWGNPLFNGRSVVVVPDPDGVQWGCDVVASAVGCNARAVCLVENPVGAGDVKDWLPKQGDRAGMRRFLKGLVDKGHLYTKGVRTCPTD